MFEADDAGSIACPHCHSGNVVEVKQKSHTKTIIIAAAAAVVVVVAVVLAVKLLRGTSTPGETRPQPDQTEQSTETPEGGSSIFEAPSVGEDELRKSGDAYADSVAAAKERADSIARAEAEAADRAEAERQAKEEATRKAREEAAKTPAIERISEAKVQAMIKTYLERSTLSHFNTSQFVSRDPKVKCNENSIHNVSSIGDLKNTWEALGRELHFKVVDLEFNDNNQVTCIIGEVY